MAGPLLVADAPHLLYRAFFALPDSITGPDGQPINALLGSVNVDPAGDRGARAARGRHVLRRRGRRVPHRRLPRLPRRPPADARRAGRRSGRRRPALYEALGWTVLDHSGLEADDLMHSLALAEERAGGKALIFTGDRDMFQCATENVHVLHAAGAQGLHRDGAGGGARALRRSGPSRCRTSSRCAATRPTGCRAPRASAPRRRPTSSSARATSSTRSSARSARSRRCGAR